MKTVKHKQLFLKASVHVFIAGLAIILSTAACDAGGTKIRKNSDPGRKAKVDMNEHAFGLSDEEFFTNPTKNSPSIGRRLVKEGFDGLLIDCPDYIQSDKRSKFPVAAIRVTESMDASLNLFKEYALVTAMDLFSNKLYVDNFVEPKFATANRDPLKYPPPPGRVFDGGAEDLFSRLKIPPNLQAEYLVTAILLDKTSNRFRVRVGPSEFEADGAKFVALLKKKRHTPTRQEAMVRTKKLLSVIHELKSPAIPEKPGVDLNVDSHWQTEEGTRKVILYGSYNIENPFLNAKESLADTAALAGKTLPITLLATGSRIPAPLTWEVNLPLLNGARDSDRESLQGFFAVELDETDGLENSQTYFIRAFTGEQVSSPLKIKLATQ